MQPVTLACDKDMKRQLPLRSQAGVLAHEVLVDKFVKMCSLLSAFFYKRGACMQVEEVQTLKQKQC